MHPSVVSSDICPTEEEYVDTGRGEIINNRLHLLTHHSFRTTAMGSVSPTSQYSSDDMASTSRRPTQQFTVSRSFRTRSRQVHTPHFVRLPGFSLSASFPIASKWNHSSRWPMTAPRPASRSRVSIAVVCEDLALEAQVGAKITARRTLRTGSVNAVLTTPVHQISLILPGVVCRIRRIQHSRCEIRLQLKGSAALHDSMVRSRVDLVSRKPIPS